MLVPINYRLSADDFAYILDHSGTTVVCVHPDYLDVVDGLREQLPQVKHFVSFGGARDGWVDYEAALAASFHPAKPPIKTARSRFGVVDRRTCSILTAPVSPRWSGSHIKPQQPASG